jgi:protein ImuB
MRTEPAQALLPARDMKKIAVEPIWLALECPHLALDLATRGQPPGQELTIAIYAEKQRRQQILDCNPTATRAGICAGMAASAALGLVAELRLSPRDPLSEQSAIERLAALCYRYSSLVTKLEDGSGLLLEIGGSQRLLGHARGIAQRLEQDVQRLGYHVRSGTAATPEAARLAARNGLHLPAEANIGRQLTQVPLETLPLDAAQQATLFKMGFRTAGELLRLPRKALGRRLGPSMVDYLDRLTGARPDPRKRWQPPEHFRAGMELAAETRSSQALLFPLRRLVAELCTILRARDRGVQQLRVNLWHERGRESLHLGLQRPGRSEERILLLLRERLQALRLAGPVRRVELEALRLLPFEVHHDSLFADGESDRDTGIATVLERLQARLGEHAVQGLTGVEDHRPEYSWAVRELGQPARCHAMPHRPVWLFNRPQRCQIEDYRLLAGPERIETGWWDGRDCRRDYFVVCDDSNRLLWAFREYKPSPGWYLQGLFA